MDENRRQFIKSMGAAAIAVVPAGSTRVPQSMLTAQAPDASFQLPTDASDSFTVKLTIDLQNFNSERWLLEMPGVLSVRLRQHDPADRKRQNYPAFKMPDGSVPVLEASLTLHSSEHPDWKEMTVGIPLAILNKPAGIHEIALNFSGVRWSLYVDGELLDNDFPFGYPPWAGTQSWKLDSEYVKSAAIYLPSLKFEARGPRASIAASDIQYWLPRGHNSWVGDVVTLFHGGRYHVFYLYDRRHHQSKFGKGAHYFEHLSTTDFKTWTEHEAATPLEEQWECIGTGTPFIFKNKLHLSYGLHTGRVYPDEKTTWPAQWEYLKKNGRTGSFRRAATPGIPAGATYSVSNDGISSFRKSEVTFHPCQNPSLYIDPAGKLRLLANAGANGIWESDSIEGGWHCVHPGFPPGGDCTFFFRWGAFDYIIGGFKMLWSKPAGAPDSAYRDVVADGLDFYDGGNVPTITEITGGRYLMAAWIPIRGWGGPLLIRELLQFHDGRIGSKWMPEVMPQVETATTVGGRIGRTMEAKAIGHSFLLSFDAHRAEAGKGSFSITFLSDGDVHPACELQIRIDDRRAQFAPAAAEDFAARQKTLREGGSPHEAGNYAIENLIGVDDRFTVRVLVRWSDKIGGSLIDAEIAGQRTMITHRPDLKVKRILFRTEQVSLDNVRIARLKGSTGES
jgi:hypothetical protein